MTTITEQLEGLLPADGNLTTKDQRIIAEAVREFRTYVSFAFFTGGLIGALLGIAATIVVFS